MEFTSELIQGCKSFDIKYQELLYKKCFPEMLGICLRYTHDRQEAEGLFNQAFLKVFEKISSYQDKGSFEGWIKRIIINTCIDFVRNKKSLNTHSLEIDNASHVKVDAEVLQSIELEDLMKIIDGLDTTKSLAFRLFVLEGYTHKEISAQLGISESNSKWQVFEARKELKVRIKKLYGENNTHLENGRQGI
ncbi:MAG: sigma-70 family RNA polymerase sigma factor [Flavobacteriales bacterium]|nr:sigma-70 family RNA polymerase sigma factor [Flavobacteriales bacterium]